MSALSKALSIGDLRRLARRRLPRILFELIESGVEDELGLARNLAAFRRYCLMPRYLTEIETRDQSVELFGRRFASPFGIGPTGFAALLRHGAEEHLAGAAAAAEIPCIVSGAAAAPIERLAEIAPGNIWYHLYAAQDPAITAAILDRVEAAGVETLVFTVDNPVYPKRERDTRNGFKLPLRLSLGTMLEAATHVGWMADYFRYGGMPLMDMWRPFAPEGSDAGEVAAFFRSQSPSIQTWRSIAAMRERWRGRFVLKGLQHPDDAVRAVEAGIDGIIVSNHGAKSFDALPSPLDTLPGVKAAVGGRVPVMLDSGIRRGADILIARSLGADFCFVGRATLYGVVAGAREGADRAIAILREEVDKGLALVGAPSAEGLDASFLMRQEAAPPAGVSLADSRRYSE